MMAALAMIKSETRDNWEYERFNYQAKFKDPRLSVSRLLRRSQSNKGTKDIDTIPRPNGQKAYNDYSDYNYNNA